MSDGLPAAARPVSRRSLLRGLLGGGAGALLGGALAGLESSAWGGPSLAQDVRVVRFLLVLEEVKAAYYDEVLRRGGLSRGLERFARTAGRHEHEHVAALRRELGAAAPAPRRVRFAAPVTPARFGRTAVLLEEQALRAYNGQGTNVTRPVLRTLLEVVSVEARHAAWVRDVLGEAPAPVAADPSETAIQVTRKLRAARLLPTP